jgi:hypothetical protein
MWYTRVMETMLRRQDKVKGLRISTGVTLTVSLKV